MTAEQPIQPGGVAAGQSPPGSVVEALRQREADLLALIENTQDAIWSVDRDYRLVAFNSALEQQFWDIYNIVLQAGICVIDCLPPDTRAMWQRYYDRALTGDRFAVSMPFTPTATQSIEVSFNPICTATGEITGVAVFSRDVTAHRQAEEALQQAKSQLQAVLDAVPGCVSWFSSDLTYLGINRYLAATFRVQAEDFIGKKLGFMASSPSFAEFVQEFFASSLQESTVEIGGTIEGAPHSYLIAAQKYDQGQAAVFVGLDITYRKQFEEALRESQERYALAMMGAKDGLWDWNLRTDEIYFSPRWKAMLGYSDGEIGTNPQEWFSRIHPEELAWVKAQIQSHVGGRTQHFEVEHRMRHKDGTFRWILSRGLAVRDANHCAYRMAGSQSDITARKQAEAQLIHDALHDPLTGLSNRALFIDRLGQALARLKRGASDCVAVLFLDLDRFKVVNESLGHAVGDQLLVAIARRLEQAVRDGDTIARLGGDEFAILMDNMQQRQDAIHLAQSLHTAFLLPFTFQGQDVFTSVSIGIAFGDSGSDRPDDLLRNANTAMYRAKSVGRSHHEVFDAAMHTQALALLQLETDLRRAVALRNFTNPFEEFELQYQPIVALADGKITGFEALVRWRHPERGLVSPADFIPIAEDTGLIIPLGQWILTEACRQMRFWQAQRLSTTALSISVNLSTRQFSQPNLIEQIQQIAALWQSTPTAMRVALKLEITESAIMEDPEAATVLLQKLKDLGIQLLIDDFGTGYSSLSYLQQFPMDTVKIDQSFVERLGRDEESSEIIRAIATLAHNLGMDVIAEGIETIQQVRQLQQLQIESGQGYFFAMPLSGSAATKLLATRSPWSISHALPTSG